MKPGTAEPAQATGAGGEPQRQWDDLHRAPAADDGDSHYRAGAQLLQRMLRYVCGPQPLMPLHSASGWMHAAWQRCRLPQSLPSEWQSWCQPCKAYPVQL